MFSLIWDVRFSLRVLAKQPGFAATAVLALAIGIGANAAVFSVVNALLLRPLPGVRDAGRIVGIYAPHVRQADTYRGFSYPNYVDIREGTRALEGVSAFTYVLAGVAEQGMTRRSLVMMVSANYFDVLGARPMLGRAFTPEEEHPGSQAQVAVVSHAYWQRRGSDPALVGRTVSINARLFTVVGVAPPGFGGTSPAFAAEFWLPLAATTIVENDLLREIAGGDLTSRDTHRFLLFGRLEPGTARETANRELAARARALAAAYPEANRDYSVVAHPLQRRGFAATPGDDASLVFISTALLGMASMVLLVACLNLANMLLARGRARRREIAIRLSIGASRAAVVRLLLVEGLLLSLGGGAAGLALGRWAMALLVRSVVPLMPMPFDVPLVLDWRVAGATLGFAAFATVVFALGPALQATRPGTIDELKGQPGEDRGRQAWLFGVRNLLLAGQVALSLALLVAGALFVRGALRAADATPGFALDRGLVAESDPSLAGYSLDEGANAHRRAVARLRELPGVEAASMASMVPFGRTDDRVLVAGGAAAPAGGPPSVAPRPVVAAHTSIGGDYFRALGIPVLRGREFSAAEAEGREPRRVAIVDEPAARRLFPPGESPIGQLVRVGTGDGGPPPDVCEIVGLVAGVRSSLSDRGPTPHLYVPFSSRIRASMHYHVRLAPGISGDGPAVAMLRRELAALDARLPPLSISTLEAFTTRSPFLWLFRAGARVFTAFGVAGLMLTLVGIWGVNACTVLRRTREIGIRTALGASPRGVIWLIVRDTTLVTAAGVVAGTALALAVATLLGSMLYEVSAADPVALVAAPVLLALCALASAYLPARKAAGVAVLAALRRE
jgi:predicted permease